MTDDHLNVFLPQPLPAGMRKFLFVSHSVARAGWYRCVLPAMYLGEGHDWAAIAGDPPGLTLVSSWVNKSTQEPDMLSYDVIVLEQVRGVRWFNLIRKLRGRGVKVLYEVDDYLHGIHKSDDHDFAQFYQKSHLKEHEQCMRACDGAIVSTQFIADKYQRVFRDRPIWVCENGLDMGRYRLTRPERGQLAGRETVTILWAGATGHQRTVIPWVQEIRKVMQKHPYVSFVSIGQDFAALLHEEFPDRVISVPFSALETYPCAMMLGDVIIAPAGKSDWARAKSDLRVMEAAALGIPVVADKHYVNSVDEGETGIVVQTIFEVEGALSRLVTNHDLRFEMSRKSREKAIAEFAMERRVWQWTKALTEVLDT